nr:T9SS type A sorting domain-containing protein [candidate division Zixibacteria bacterium]
MFAFSLPQETAVSLNIYNVLGQRVITLVDSPIPAGDHQLTWDGYDCKGRLVTSGIYFARFIAGDFTCTKKIIMMK